jgi:hypothetical protein
MRDPVAQARMRLRPDQDASTPSKCAPRPTVADVTRRRSFTTEELAEVAAGLRQLLDVIARGELVAEPGEINRLEGAVAALEALSRGESPPIV